MNQAARGPFDIIRDVMGCIQDARVTARVTVAPTDAPVGKLKIRLAGEFTLTLELVVKGGEIDFAGSVLSIDPEIKPLPGVRIEGLGLGPEGTIQVRVRGFDPIDFHRFVRQIPRVPRSLRSLAAWLLPESTAVSEPSSSDNGGARRPSFGLRPQFDLITLSVPSLTLRPESSVELRRGERMSLQEVSKLEIRAVEDHSLDASASFRFGDSALNFPSVSLDVDRLAVDLSAKADLRNSSWHVSADDINADLRRLLISKKVELDASEIRGGRVIVEWSDAPKSLRWSVENPVISAARVAPTPSEPSTDAPSTD